MRKIWVRVEPWDKDLVTTAIEGGADAIMVPDGFADRVRALGKIQTIAEDGDLKPGRDVVFHSIAGSDDEDEIVRLSREKKVILETEDWTIIPLENLIARQADIVARVANLDEAVTAFGVLEKGVSHVLLEVTDPVELKKILSALREESETVVLDPAEIVDIQSAGMGDRVCVDTCTAMGLGEGMLVGNSSSGLFLVHAESISNPYVAPRPFRVNAGPVHAYTRVPGGKTRYLSELAAGDPVLVVDATGKAVTATVGRLKIEKRPLMLLTAMVRDQKITTLIQNAETIRLTDPDGNPRSIVDLKIGDKILVALESAGRHFGIKIDEQITER